jgi:methylated-DNA-[protein]-cysteine S-methyltransferase
MKTAQYIFASPVGPLYLIASATGLRALYFRKPAGPFVPDLKGEEPEIKILKNTVAQLEEYFAGLRKDFDLPLEAEGTGFQKKVWSELGRIPYGKTYSYGEIAKKIKNDKAVRAVGTANGRNPISIIVPCHRVIAADGTLGGYGGGLDIKTKLLAIEGLRF